MKIWNSPVENESESYSEGSDCISSSQTQAEVHGRCERSSHPSGRNDNEHVDEKCEGAEEDQHGRPSLVDFGDVLCWRIDFIVHDSALIGHDVIITIAVTCVEPRARRRLTISPFRESGRRWRDWRPHLLRSLLFFSCWILLILISSDGLHSSATSLHVRNDKGEWALYLHFF